VFLLNPTYFSVLWSVCLSVAFVPPAEIIQPHLAASSILIHAHHNRSFHSGLQTFEESFRLC